MHEIEEKEQDYHCECCHCKKIFMLLVLLLLSFIAGIMVGNCNSNHHRKTLYDTSQMIPQATHSAKFHRGAKPTNSGVPVSQSSNIVFEVESSD